MRKGIKDMIPCKDCLVLAMCKNRSKLYCSSLHEWAMKTNPPNLLKDLKEYFPLTGCGLQVTLDKSVPRDSHEDERCNRKNAQIQEYLMAMGKEPRR